MLALWEVRDSHYFSLLHPPCLGSVPHFAFPSSVSISAISPSVDLILLSVDVFVVSPSFIFFFLFHGSYLFHPPTTPFLPLFIFWRLFSLPLSFFPFSFRLIYLFLTTSHVSFLYSPPLPQPHLCFFFFFCLSQLCVSLSSISAPPSQAH